MNNTEAPADWLAVLEESEADLEAGRIVPGEMVMRDLHDSLARLEAQAAGKPKRKAPAHR